jgi:hypothetical protein
LVGVGVGVAPVPQGVGVGVLDGWLVNKGYVFITMLVLRKPPMSLNE